MQRVVSINLSGNAYQLEENGYNALFAYLDATDAQLKDSPDRVQRLADLEQVVAGKCQACLGPHKTVVTSAEVDRILFDLGPIPGQPAAGPAPSDASSSSSSAASNASSDSTTGSTSTAGAGPTHRRLYQVREGAMISGVCMGLAEFLHLDVTLIRILFVIFALVTSGWGILAYGVLMVVVPKVNTRAEAAGDVAAAGTMPPHRWPWDDHGWPWGHPGWPWDHPRDAQPAWRDAPQPTPTWRDERRAARMAGRPWGPWGTISMIMCIGFAFFWLSLWTHGGFFFGWPYFWGFPHWIGIVVFFMVMRMIFMPFRMARRYRYGYGPYGPYDPYDYPHHAWLSMWHGMMWFAVMIFAIWVAFHYIPEFHTFIRDFQTSWQGDGFHV